MTILVTGATGTVGGAVVREFQGSGRQVRGLVRSPERGDDLRGFDAQMAVGRYEQPESLDDALRGVTAALLVSPTGPDQVAQETAFVDAAARAALRPHVVKIAAADYQAGATRFARSHREIVEVLAASGLPYTVLAPAGFAQNLLASAAAVQAGTLPGMSGDGAVAYVDARDIARVAVAVLTDPAPHVGAEYRLTGPEALDNTQVAAVLADVLGEPVRPVDVHPDDAAKQLADHGVPEWHAGGLVELWSLYRAGAQSVVTDDVQRVTGLPPRSLAQFVADHSTPFLTT